MVIPVPNLARVLLIIALTVELIMQQGYFDRTVSRKYGSVRLIGRRQKNVGALYPSNFSCA